MTVGAIGARLLFLMALDATRHGYIPFAIEPLALCDLPVAVCAGAPGGQMRAMAEKYVTRNLVNPHPPNRAPFGIKGGKSFYRGFIGGFIRMASHTNRSRRKSHPLARIGVAVANGALYYFIARVLLVAEWQRLFGSYRRLASNPCRCSQYTSHNYAQQSHERRLGRSAISVHFRVFRSFSSVRLIDV